MPFLSRSQARFAHANPEKFGGASGLKEWDKATNFQSLPEKKDPPMEHKKMWLRSAIKDKSHPVQRAAQRKGISTLQEAERESHSSSPHIRSRGLLGVRLAKKKI